MRRPPFIWASRFRRWIGAHTFLFVSILAHILLAMIATVLIVQTIAAQRKLTFLSAPPAANPSRRATEHRVQMAKRQRTQSAPQNVKRIVSIAPSRVALPEMPAIPLTASIAAPARMAGMGGFGAGLSLGGSGGGTGGDGGPVPLFGFRDRHRGALAGTFYDLKQTPDHRQTPIGRPGAEPAYNEFVRRFVKRGWNEGELNSYFHPSTQLYATQIYIPIGESAEAAKAFDVESEVQGDRWMVLYKGKISAPRDGTFRFVGRGDNILVVRLDGRVVFDGSWEDVIEPHAVADQNSLGPCSAEGWQLAGGQWFTVQQGQAMDFEAIIGDTGGAFSDFLLIEEKGAVYGKRSDAPQYTAYPLFQTAKGAAPAPSFNEHWRGMNPETAKTPVIFGGMPADPF